jgi:hypothetical protein
MTYLLRTVKSWPVEFRQSINRDQYLHRTYTVQQMRVMSRSCAEASIYVLTRQHKLDRFISRQAIRMAQ